MKTDPRFERLIAGQTPVLAEDIPATEGKNNGLLKNTYVVDAFVGQVEFPEGVVFSLFAATETLPEYSHAKVGGTHIHLTEGLMPGQEKGLVKVELRIRTVEPTTPDPEKEPYRNYEVVIRLSPTTATQPQKRVVVEPARDNRITVVDADGGILIHKGGYTRVNPIAAQHSRGGGRRDDIHRPDRSQRW